jgi:inward rectifier potassium channel
MSQAQGSTREQKTNRSRRLVKNGRLEVHREGVQHSPLKDLYYFLMSTRWRWFLAVWIGSYLLLNALFACAYLALGAEIRNSEPGSFLDAFFFSVQTMSTIGFGHLAPGNVAANAVVVAESIVGLLGTAMSAGLIFAKFARPPARLSFSSALASGFRDGRPALMFRVGNQRGNHITGGRMKLILTYLEMSVEDELVRRFIPLSIERPHNELFSLVWQGTHFLDGASPLGEDPRGWLEERQAQLLVTVSGLDQDLGQELHVSYAYLPEDIVEGARLQDMFSEDGQGMRIVDFSRFHETIPMGGDAS